MMEIKKGTKVKLLNEGKHVISGMESKVNKEYTVLEVSTLKALNPQFSKKYNQDYKLYALFPWQVGVKGVAWFSEESLEVVPS